MKNIKTYTVDEALKALCRYCVYQDRCHHEVENKLKSMRMIPEARNHIIAELIKHDFLNEERFAMNYVWGKFNQKGWGKVRLSQELRRRKITSYLINKALGQISESEYIDKLNHLAQKKYDNQGKDDSWSSKAKLKNHLIYKGFESNLVIEVINDLYNF